MPAARRPAATRRTALAAGLVAVLAVAACDPAGGPADPAPSAAADPDEALVREAVAGLRAAAAAAAAVAVRHPGLAPAMQRLRRLHDAHLAILGPATGAASSAATPHATPDRTPATPAAALRAVRHGEQRLQERLVGWAVAARSGALARLLASMSAAVSQQVATLPAAPA